MTRAMSKKEKQGILFKIIKGTIRIFYRKREMVGRENIPSEPCLLIGNHAKSHGPLTCELFMPDARVWCIGEMLSLKEAPKYMFQDFWANKPKWSHPIYKFCAYFMAPIVTYVFKNVHPVPVYKDMRIVRTFKGTVDRLEQGKNVLIFPEHHVRYNEIVNEFQENFVDVARVYYKKHGKALSFVPVYNAVSLKKVVFGKPIVFQPDKPIEQQRKEICDYVKKEITSLAKDLPAHKVVPYDNLPRRKYRLSK